MTSLLARRLPPYLRIGSKPRYTARRGFPFLKRSEVSKIDTKSLKREIRSRVKKIRNSFSKKEVIDKSKKIWGFLIKQKEYIDAQVIMFYSAIDNEVQTDFMINQSIGIGKKIALPQTAQNVLIPRLIPEYPSGLFPKSFGILEPDDSFPVLEKEDIDLVIVPGLAFSFQCMRIGYGKGYYDRFLKNYKGNKIGLAFWEQITRNLPIDDYDVPLNKVITDKIIIDCNKN